jgi:hypothetical protein
MSGSVSSHGLPAPPRQVLLFSGHLMDKPDRATPRFPASAEPLAAEAIAAALDAFDAGPQDLALSQAAAGGDLLFIEACQQRGVHCEVLLPFAEEEFIERSVLPSSGGADWRRRYLAATRAANTNVHCMPDELGALNEGEDPFELCNQWLLDSALAASGNLHCMVLWNGAIGDGPGGTAHMVREVRRHAGQVTWLDTRKLFGLP